jgi:hypothetical protein
MSYPYATFYLEAQRAKRNLLHVFEAEPDVPVADPVLPAAKCAPAQARKKKADSRLNLSELFRHSLELLTRPPTRGALPAVGTLNSASKLSSCPLRPRRAQVF